MRASWWLVGVLGWAGVAEAADVSHTVGVRARRMVLPGAFLSLAASKEATLYEDTVFEETYERPGVGMNAFGLEYSITPGALNVQGYVEYWNATMDEGYWVSPGGDQETGSWIAPENLGAVAIGGNVGHEVALTDDSQPVWLGFRFGGGLGVAVLTGRMDLWTQGREIGPGTSSDCAPLSLAPERAEVCDPDKEAGVPPVLPVLDLDVAMNLHVTENAFVRLDGGLHSALFAGVTAGGRF